MSTRCRSVLLFFGVLAIGSPVAPLSAQPPEAIWYIRADSAGLASLEANASRITVVAPQAHSIDRTGTIRGSIHPRILRVVRERGVKLMPLVMNPGFDVGILHHLVTDGSARTAAARSFAGLCRELRPWGIQLDLENLHVSDRDAFTKFAGEVADSVRRAGCGISAAVVPRMNDVRGENAYHHYLSDYWRAAYDYPALARALDFLSYMTYAQHTGGSTPGPVAGYPWMLASLEYVLAQGVPPNKLSLGIPGYSDYWFSDYSERGGARPRGVDIGYLEVMAIMTKAGATPQWDPSQRSLFGMWERHGVFEHAWIEDARAFREKLALVGRYKLRGYSVWLLGMEDPATWEVVQPPAQPTTGARRFDRTLALEDSGYTSASASVGDVNRDGHLDVILVKGRHWPLRNLVLLGDGRGHFAPPVPVDTVADRSYSGILVDLDRDGALDLVVSNDSPDAKKIYRNDGTGRYQLVTTFGSPDWNTRHVAVGDVNGDGLPDMALANRGSRQSVPSMLCLGAGGGRIAEPCREISTGSATTITMADVNSDRALDLLVPHRDGGQGYILLNDGHGAFPTRIPFGPAKATIRAAHAADFDGDGVMDLAAIDELGSALIMRGVRGGGYADAEPLGPATARPYAMTVHDVDGNGRADVVVGYTDAQPYVFFNDGPGRFTPVAFGDAKGVAYGITVADLDEDGLLDLVVARSEAPNMVYFGGR